MRSSLLLLFTFLIISTASAQLRFEVDIRTESKSSEVANPVAFDHRVFFSADDTRHGSELWVHEPSTDRTYLLADLFLGLDGSFPRNFVQTNDYLYFYAKIDRNSDGLFQLARGTNLVERVPGRGTSSNHTDLTLFKGKLMVGTEFALSERNLSTNRETRLHPTTGSNSANIRFLGQDNDNLYFSSFSLSTSAIEIFSYDGTDVMQLTDFGSQSIDVEVKEGALVQNHLALKLDITDRLCLIDLNNNSFRIDSTVELSHFQNDYVINHFEVFENELYIKVDQGLHDIKRYDFTQEDLDPSFSVRPWANARWGLETHDDKLYGWFHTSGSTVDSFFQIVSSGNHTPIPALVDVAQNAISVVNVQNQFTYLNGKLYGYGDLREKDFEPISYDLTTQRVTRLKDINQASLPAGPYQTIPFDQDWLILSGRLDSTDRYQSIRYGDPGVKLYNPTTRELKDIRTLHPDIDWSRGFIFREGNQLLLQNTSIRNEVCNLGSLDLLSGELICADTIGAMGNIGNSFAPPIAFNGKLYYGDQSDQGLSYSSFLESITPGLPGSRSVADPDSIFIVPTGAYNNNWLTTDDALFMIEGTNIYTRPGPDFKLVRMDTNEVFSTIDIDTFKIIGNPVHSFSDRLFWSFNHFSHIAYFKPGESVKPLKYNGEHIARMSSAIHPIETDTTIFFTSEERFFSMNKATDEVQLLVDIDSVSSDTYRGTYLLGKIDSFLLFSARQYIGGEFYPNLGNELFQYNLSSGVVSLVSDINPGNKNSNPNYGTLFNDRFYFFAEDPYRDQELWSYSPNCFTINLTVSADSSNTSPNGSGTVTTNGGQAPYSYQWSNGETTSTATNLPAGFVEVTVTDDEGCTTSTNGWIETVFPVISVSDANEIREIEVSIYPNPTRDIITISTKEQVAGDYTIQLFDVSGRVLLSQKHQILYQQTLDLSSYSKGIYFLQLENRDTQSKVVRKIVRE